MLDIDQLAHSLTPHYSHFKVSERLLFTGHSHQAWPDVALEGQKEYFLDSAELVDKKWEKAAEKTEILRNYLRNFYDDPDGFYCREENTHFLFVRSQRLFLLMVNFIPYTDNYTGLMKTDLK